MPKATTSVSVARKEHLRHNPLSEDLSATVRIKSKKRKTPSNEDIGDNFVDSKSSRKILKIGQDLADEEHVESTRNLPSAAFTFESRFQEDNSSDEELQQQDWEEWEDRNDEIVEDLEVDPHDLNLFNKLMPEVPSSTVQPGESHSNAAEQGTNLADIILEQIAAHEAAQQASQEAEPIIYGEGVIEDAIELPAKVVEVYTKIGLILSRFKSGKLPKPFKIIPTLPQWEDLLSITRPEAWTANGCEAAMKIFISSNPLVAQRFLESVILPRVREDIHENKKLNVHLYDALKKAIYKPAAFFKGLLFPLVKAGCTLREAHIISSVLVRKSIPVLHAAAALMRLTDIAAEQASASTEGGGSINVFLRALLEKKYALPYKVIDNLVFHFLRFRAIDAGSPGSGTSGLSKEWKLPVLWHQSLLAFAQRYRNDITEDQREALLDLLLIKGHKEIGPEVRRELLEGRGRGIPVQVENVDINGDDDTMVLDHT